MYTTFTSSKTGDCVRITIEVQHILSTYATPRHKRTFTSDLNLEKDQLEMTTAELSMWGILEEKQYSIIVWYIPHTITTCCFID